MEALLDTGSQVTTLSESFFNQNLRDTLHLNASSTWLTLTAANGLEIPKLGYLVTTVEVDGETVNDGVVMVTRDHASGTETMPCILGMNVLQRLTTAPSQLTKKSEPDQKEARLCLARSQRTDILIPPQTVVNVTVTAGDPSC